MALVYLSSPILRRERWCTHSGGWPGYVTRVTWLADKDETIILLSNNGTNNSLIDAGIEIHFGR